MKVTARATDRPYHLLRNISSICLQTMGWVGTGVDVRPLGGGDVIERLAAGTGELDGDESEDDDLWDGLSG